MEGVVYTRTAKFGIFEVTTPNATNTDTTVSANSISVGGISEVESSISEAEQLFNKIYESVSYERAKDASLDARAKMTAAEKIGLTYGEVVFKSMETIFKCLWRYAPEFFAASGGVFYDLGSGSGRPVMMAATLHSFSSCIGIEVLPSLHELALEAKSTYDALTVAGRAAKTRPEVSCLLGSILNLDICDWTNGDVVFSNSTAFDDALFIEVAKIASRLRPGALVVTLTANIEDRHNFEILEELRLEMSW
jgi:SAM-dependent methyltransferase